MSLPGGTISTRPLHFIWILDCSGSMAGDKIQALNNAIREALPHMQKVAEDNINAEVLVRAVTFSDGAHWHIPNPIKIEDFEWKDVSAFGQTSMGRALSLVASALDMPPMTDRALPPVLVLVSDGMPTDNFDVGLKELLDKPWGKKAVRIAIAIGQDADYDVLEKFISNIEIKPLRANNVDSLVQYIRWVSTVVIKTVSAPPSQVAGQTIITNVPIPTNIPQPISHNDVW